MITIIFLINIKICYRISVSVSNSRKIDFKMRCFTYWLRSFLHTEKWQLGFSLDLEWCIVYNLTPPHYTFPNRGILPLSMYMVLGTLPFREEIYWLLSRKTFTSDLGFDLFYLKSTTILYSSGYNGIIHIIAYS